METVRFNLHTHRYGTIVRLVFRFNGYKFVYYPGIAVDKADWNAKSSELRKGAKNWQEVNAALRRLKNEVERIYIASLGTPDKLTPALLKLELDIFWKGKTIASKAVTVAQFVRLSASSRMASGQIRKSTSAALGTLATLIERYNASLTFDDVNLDFHKDFTAFMISNDKAPNTIASAIKRLKNVMGQAIDAGLTNNQAFRSARFASKESDVDSIYLSERDVEKIESVAITSPMQIAVRDSFLLGVYTGLRYSDFSELTPGDFQTHEGVFMVRKRMKKTSRIVAAPISDKALAILKRYDMKPPTISNQVLNRYIKDVACMAGIDDMVGIEKTRGNTVTKLMLPKWRLVSTHTARRTFATLGYLRAVAAGRDYEPIMDILGHRSRQTFMKYIKVTAEQRAALWAKQGG